MPTENNPEMAATNLRSQVEAAPLSPSPSGRRFDKANPWLRVIFNESRRRRIRILIVADGSISFNDADFGLSELIDKGLLPSATPWEELSVVTAHRSANEPAHIRGFRFDQLPDPPYDFPFTTEYYEQVWLFGFNRANDEALSEAELAILAGFMNAGGGVFATGDHEDLGAALCGAVPRVRSMRKWFVSGVRPALKAPGRDDATRTDTLREGIDPGFSSDDQADHLPQEIRPRFKQAEGCRNAEPHPLLAHGSFAVSVLPDHMHEGECVAPTDLEGTFSFGGAEPADEFPPLPGTIDRPAPEVVAITTSAAGGYLQEALCIPPVEPRGFNVIVAYDGQPVGVGRVAVDASFHHFVNINLKGEEGGNPQKRGLYDEAGNPTKEYVAIKQYYRNLVIWLCPPEVRFEYYVRLLVGLRYLSPLIEEIRSREEPTLEDVLYAGAVTQNAISERFSRGEATQCALALAATLPNDLRAAAVRFTDPWLPPALRGAKQSMFFDAGVLPKVILGSAMQGIAASLPEKSCDVSAELEKKESQGRRLESFIAAGLARGVSLMIPALEELGGVLRSLSSALSSLSPAEDDRDI